MPAEEFDLEALVHVEQTFFQSGYQDGYDHGRIHGLIEGRALGREKGYEMWEELGFYESFALTWKAFLLRKSVAEDDMNNIKRLLELIHQFPMVNPSTADLPSDLDIPQLLRRIRSRYKTLCSSLGVRPSIRAASSSQAQSASDGLEEHASDTQQPRPKVWPLRSQPRNPTTAQDLSY